MKKPKPQSAVPQVIESHAIEQVTRGEVEIQAGLAVRFPRDPQDAQSRTLAEATLDEETAAECFYSLRKGGKAIEGPSVRLTEIAAKCWGNMRSGSRIVDVGETLVTAQGYAWDLETNYFVVQERQRRITDRNGRRYSDDMIVTTANAASSIAFREAVIKVIGKNRLNQIWKQCRSVAVGDQRSVNDRYDAAVAHFSKMGIDEERMLTAVDRKRRADVTPEDLAKLIGLSNAIRENETSIDDAFPPQAKDETPPEGKRSFGKKKTEPQPEPEPETPEAPTPDAPQDYGDVGPAPWGEDGSDS